MWDWLTFDWDGYAATFEKAKAQFGVPASQWERDHGNWARTGFAYFAFEAASGRQWEISYSPGRNGVVSPEVVTVEAPDLYAALIRATGGDVGTTPTNVIDQTMQAGAGAAEKVQLGAGLVLALLVGIFVLVLVK